MRDFTEASLTEAVLARIGPTTTPRLRVVMTSLLRHLHALIRETELTDAEWFAAIQFLTATGQMCDDKRQEFILLSDTLGVSMLVDAINHRRPSGATENTVLGPFHVPGAPELPNGASIAEGIEAGEPTFVSGRVLAVDGRPIRDALLDVWQVRPDRLYDVQDPAAPTMQLRGKFRSDAQGRFAFRTARPVSYAIPDDGTVGKMLRALGRHPWRPAHIHFIVSAPSYDPVTTHLFVDGDPYLDSDAVFGLAPDGSTLAVPYFTVDYDFGLKPRNA